ncbi:hypothetical protein BDDG_13091 [Blastomyces dermatitidis ATCC 18188]|uniref:Uncharacterized protein n=1 Tax=Ajellomyces dermatitidis (strain ATCC 18188 / CBS 674.68) TaxID=653446 RepID=A0A0J9ES45_AJEDA|nr:hypothetical protein BDFG_07451 [Blastomyces dermatitidis ATCC 26199]KMW68872.1 hypothetical protein BDDG_13091 [Blastomyces dermatitidis ATCC 18188]
MWAWRVGRMGSQRVRFVRKGLDRRRSGPLCGLAVVTHWWCFISVHGYHDVIRWKCMIAYLNFRGFYPA